jgi:hypothetical protein
LTRSFSVSCAYLLFDFSPVRPGIHPARTGLTSEYCGMPVALVAYVGALARLAIVQPAFVIKPAISHL